jgi:hypothetical protein
MIRRKAALYDTGLVDLKDYANTFNSSPLTAEGSFGAGFDEQLKLKQERIKQISEVHT